MKKLKILIDLTATDNSYALWLLLEKRLGHEVYFMKGVEWFEKGYWNYVPMFAPQFLVGQVTGYWPKHDWRYRTMTFEEWEKNKDIDVFICSISGVNEKSFMKLIDDYKLDAHAVRYIGCNYEHIFEDSCRNILNPSSPTDQCTVGFTKNIIEAGRNLCNIHVEFDTENEFKFLPVRRYDRISSYQGSILTTESYKALWDEMKALLPEFDWHLYGGQNTHGGYNTGKELGESFADTTFVWQTKASEWGGGHITHNAFACGRPLICKKSWFDGIMAEMLIDGETCIDLDARTPQENAEFIRECAKPENYQKMSEKMYNIFREYVDWEKEGQQVQEFLERLQ